MKFGKHIVGVVDGVNPEWAPFFLNYKALKMVLKKSTLKRQMVNVHRDINMLGVLNDRREINKGGSSGDSRRKESGLQISSGAVSHKEVSTNSRRPQLTEQQPERNIGQESMVVSLEAEFFRLLHSEIRKCVSFFESQEKQLRVRLQCIKAGWKQTRDRESLGCNCSDLRSSVLRSCVTLYKDVLLLEQFDKKTLLKKREQFMKVVVSRASFVQFAGVEQCTDTLEKLFDEIQGSVKFRNNSSDGKIFEWSCKDSNGSNLTIDSLLAANSMACDMANREVKDIINAPVLKCRKTATDIRL